MKKTALLLLACALWVAPVAAQQSVIVPATTTTQAIAGTASGTTTRIITGATGKSIYITAIAIIPVATASVTLVTGTGTNCGTSASSALGPLIFATGQVLNYGDGYGTVFIVPSATDLCINITAAAAPGTVAFAQF